MQGLGDNIYQRAVLREVAEPVYLSTSWPQLYSDLPNVHPLRPETMLRTQLKNIKAIEPRLWSVPPTLRHKARMTLHYVNRPGSMLSALEAELGVRARTFDLPPFRMTLVGRPYVVVRPATVRAEWRADARNPDPAYLAAATAIASKHFTVISVADLSPNREWALDPLPRADITYHSGELSLEALMGLVRGAAGVIGGVGWLVPAAIAYKVPMLLVYGGWGRDNGPARILDPAMDTSVLTQVLPDNFCTCDRRDHACDKRIGDFDVHARNWVDRLLARWKPSVVA
jgi:hypothetical protein